LPCPWPSLNQMLILIETLEDLEASEVDTVASEAATEEAMEDTEEDLEVMAVKEVMDGADKKSKR
jgi:hypothetical protein